VWCFDRENRPNWDQEIRDDVIEECNKHGGVLHIYVDKTSPQGNVYVKCPTISAAVTSVTALHGRFFGGKLYFDTSGKHCKLETNKLENWEFRGRI
jgi:hypothetical protein